MQTQHLFVFTGTSGSGRKTIARKIGGEFGLAHIVSCTTRPPRDPGRPDADYHYISKEKFAEWEKSGQFIQTAEINRHKYGVLASELAGALSGGRSAYLILNREGASAVKKQFGDQVVRIFIYVDKQTVRERLESKGFPYETVSAYLDQYLDEVTYRKHCEHVVENVRLEHTLEQLRAIFRNY